MNKLKMLDPMNFTWTAGVLIDPVDWLTIGANVARIDVRATLRTRDGALLYLQYRGRSDVTHGIGSAPIIVAPTFETSDERYLWLNAVQAIGKGSLAARRYEWFEVL